jgi:hypothetical protein
LGNEAASNELGATPSLEWEDFVAAYFPGSRRHNLEAIAAYAAYKRSHPSRRQSPNATRLSNAEQSTSVEAWEDDGGSTLEGEYSVYAAETRSAARKLIPTRVRDGGSACMRPFAAVRVYEPASRGSVRREDRSDQPFARG